MPSVTVNNSCSDSIVLFVSFVIYILTLMHAHMNTLSNIEVSICTSEPKPHNSDVSKITVLFFLYCWLPVADAMHDKVISGTHLLNIRYIVNLHHKSGLTLLWFLSYFNPCFCHTLYLTFIQKYQQKNTDKLVNAVCCYFRKFCWSRILSPTWWKR